MVCTCNPNFHKSTALTAAGVMTVSNPNNVANLDPFFLVLTINPNTVITGAPVDFTITVNGSNVPLLNRFALPISTDRLRRRRLYEGRYIVPTTGAPYVILLDTPCNIAYALSSASVARTDDSSGS